MTLIYVKRAIHTLNVMNPCANWMVVEATRVWPMAMNAMKLSALMMDGN